MRISDSGGGLVPSRAPLYPPPQTSKEPPFSGEARSQNEAIFPQYPTFIPRILCGRQCADCFKQVIFPIPTMTLRGSIIEPTSWISEAPRD